MQQSAASEVLIFFGAVPHFREADVRDVVIFFAGQFSFLSPPLQVVHDDAHVLFGDGRAGRHRIFFGVLDHVHGKIKLFCHPEDGNDENNGKNEVQHMAIISGLESLKPSS